MDKSGSPPGQASPFHPDDELRISCTLPAHADKTAVFCGLAKLAGHIDERYARQRWVAEPRVLHDKEGRVAFATVWHPMSPKEWRERWARIEELTRLLGSALHEVRPLRTVPDPPWFLPTLETLKTLRDVAVLNIEAQTARVEARSRGYDVDLHTVIDTLLRIWTDVAGGELRYSRDRDNVPSGPLIRFLVIMLDLLLERPTLLKAKECQSKGKMSADRPRRFQTFSMLANVINSEKERRKRTEAKTKAEVTEHGMLL